ncbi:hypothetical protein ACHAXN_010748 [Cyclotella atomus]
MKTIVMTLRRYLLIANFSIVACLLTTSQRQRTTCRCDPLLHSSVSGEKDVIQIKKSAESSFWQATPQSSSESSSLPAIHGIERETGSLPPRAYQTIASERGDESNICLIGVKIRPPANPNQGDDIWTEGVKNCQKMIDSGFNSFSVGNSYGGVLPIEAKQIDKTRVTKQYLEAAKKLQDQYTATTLQRHAYESNFYSKLRQNTPSSVLRSCQFAVDMEIPSILHVSDPILDKNKPAPSVSYGNGWAVRKSISDALLRIKTDCLDSVILEYKSNSAYHLDVLNTLCEMKLEGIIKLVSTKKFPPSLLQSALGCGFDIYANEGDCSLLNTRSYLQSDMRLVDKVECKQIVSAPLAGGLLTTPFRTKEDIRQLTSIDKQQFAAVYTNLGCDSAEKWSRYRKVIDTVDDIAFKHRVAFESVALRWLLQVNPNNMISVGSKLGMDLAEENGGLPFTRQSQLRQVFGFSLEEEDMHRLSKVADVNQQTQAKSSIETKLDGDFIDFNDKSLWV